MKHQNRSKSIDSYLVNIIEESVKAALQRKAVQEKERQAAITEEDDDAEEEKTTAPPADDSEKSKLEKGDVTVDDIIDKLNTIRSGKSFKDEKITSALDKYLSGLDKAEKTALLAFLKGISQVVTGEIAPETAIDPSSTGPDVAMKKTTGPKKVTIKPSVIKAPDIEKSKKPSAEDASGPVPIQPKK